MMRELIKVPSERSQHSPIQKICGIFPHLFYKVYCEVLSGIKWGPLKFGTCECHPVLISKFTIR